LITSPTP